MASRLEDLPLRRRYSRAFHTLLNHQNETASQTGRRHLTPRRPTRSPLRSHMHLPCVQAARNPAPAAQPPHSASRRTCKRSWRVRLVHHHDPLLVHPHTPHRANASHEPSPLTRTRNDHRPGTRNGRRAGAEKRTSTHDARQSDRARQPAQQPDATDAAPQAELD